MGTRAKILIKQADKTYKGITVFFDGYPDYTGELLTKFYSNKKAVNNLIELGDCSILKSTLKETKKESYKISPEVYQTLNDACRDRFIEYMYIYQNGKWNFYFFSKKEC